MAKPIEPTPILEGRDAEILLHEIQTHKFDPKKAEFLKECSLMYSLTKRN